LDDNGSLRISKSILNKVSDKNKFKIEIEKDFVEVY